MLINARPLIIFYIQEYELIYIFVDENEGTRIRRMFF